MSELYVSGPELLDKVVCESAWTESDAAYFIKQTLELLQHLHSEGVVVVDLKPWDILLSIPGSDEVKLVDLGFARRLTASRDVRTTYGTGEFVAPEVIAGEPLTPSADVWSVGVLAYILLSGISPFYNQSERATLLTVQGADWDFDAKAFENVSKEARDLIGKILLKEAGERLTITECLDHPWIKNAIKRGQGLKINITNHKALNDRYRTMRSSAAVKTVADIRPLGKQTEAIDESGLQPEVDPATGDTVYPDSQAYGEYLDEETWLDWQTRYQHGPGTQLMPLKETDLPLRIREYRRQKRGEVVREAKSPSRESEMGEDRKMMKERLLVADVEAEFEPSPSRRKEFEWIVQPEEVKEARRRTSSESESQPQKTVGVRSDEEKSPSHPGLHYHHAHGEVKGFSPVFLEKLKDAAYLVGDDVTFSCHVMASPAPSITWYRNEGMLSDGQRIRTSLTEDGRASITVLNTMPNDVGVYKCIVRNKLGTVTSRARLLLGDTPERPGRPVVCAVSSDEALLIWDAPKSDGNSYITNYRVDYRKAGEIRSRDTFAVNGEDRWTSAVSVLDECALVPGLKPNTIYRFRVSCSNRFGVSPFSWSSVEVRTKPPGAPAVSIDEEIERLLLRSRKALEKPSPRESAMRSPSLMMLETIEEEMKTTSPEEEFNFGEEIRKGGFSSIKCVSRKVGGEEFVAKVAPSDSQKKDELIREFSVLRPLQQENIVRLVSGYQTPQQVCLIMERLYGDNVVQHLSFKNTYTEESVSIIIQQVLDAVQYLHHCGVAHLNLQPSSVMLASRRRLDVKLVDFSLARSITSPEGSHMPKMGFPDFLSPEMVAQEKVGFAADVWTIGALTFLLLSGESPFLGETDLETFANIAYIRYDAQDLYENVTKEGLKFIYDLLKRLPRNRLGVEECLEHKWLQLTPNMVKARQEAVFLSNKLRRYAKDYHKKRLERSGVFILSSTPPPLASKPKNVEAPALSEKNDTKADVGREPVAADMKKVKPRTPSPEPKAKTRSPEPVKKVKQKTPSPEPVQEQIKPKTPSPEPKHKTPSPVPKHKTPSPEPIKEEVKLKTPSPEAVKEEGKPKTPSPEPVKQEVKPKTPSPEPVQEEVKPKTPSPEPVLEAQKTEIDEKAEVSAQPTVKEISSEEGSPVSSVEEKSETGVDIVEMVVVEGETTSEEVTSSLYITEEPVTPIPGPTPDRETALEENIQAIIELSEETTATEADASVKFEGSVEMTASQSQSQTIVEYSEESSSTSQTLQMSSVVESQQSSSVETTEEVSMQFSTPSETVEEVVSLNEKASGTQPTEESSLSADVTVTLSTDESLSKLDDGTVDVSGTVENAVPETGIIDEPSADNVVHEVDVSLTDVTSEDVTNAATLIVDSLETTEANATDVVVNVTETDVSSDVTLAAVGDDVATTDVTVSTDVNLTLTVETSETVDNSTSIVQESFELSLPEEEPDVTASEDASQSQASMSFTVTSTSDETSVSVDKTVRLDGTPAEREVSSAIVEEETSVSVDETVRLNGNPAQGEMSSAIVEEETVSVDETVRLDGAPTEEEMSNVIVEETVQLDTASTDVTKETDAEQVEINTTPSESSDAVLTESVTIIEQLTGESVGEVVPAVATEEQGSVEIFSHRSQEVISEMKATGNVSELSAVEMASSAAEEVDIFGEDDDYFAKRSKRATRAMEIVEAAEEFHVQEEEESDSSRRSSRRSRRSARSYEISGSEEGIDRPYSEDYMSSRRSRRSARSYEITSGTDDSADISFSEDYASSRRSRRSGQSYEASETNLSSRESRRSGWRSRLGDL